MLALGCLVPVVTLFGGAWAGSALAGQQGLIWGAVAGLVVGLAVPALMLRGLLAARRHR
ncbi:MULTISPECIES: hypothetical protein [unclassified Sphingosinithalassobacter]|uniref:hypothetical protein n=1 Tax=unclassified Sphingosinithalassobacter TaxID=2676235 RepID=UPI00165D3F1C|nr:hypothetical protein [Sphingosinithalassobacter sp. CS137]